MELVEEIMNYLLNTIAIAVLTPTVVGSILIAATSASVGIIDRKPHPLLLSALAVLVLIVSSDILETCIYSGY